MFRWIALSSLVALTWPAWAEKCPGVDEDPTLSVKTSAGPTLVLCGFEDHEVQSPDGKRAFSDFTIYYTTSDKKEPQKLFSSEAAETFWIKPIEGKGFELEEIWFFVEKPKAALWREITCTGQACTASDLKCVFKMKANPFPKALVEFEQKKKKNELTEAGEELLDQIWAQALLGDKAAQSFYTGTLEGLDENLTEIFSSNKKKLADLKTISCRQ